MRSKRWFKILAVFTIATLVLALFAPAAWAGGPPPGKGNPHGDPPGQERNEDHSEHPGQGQPGGPQGNPEETGNSNGDIHGQPGDPGNNHASPQGCLHGEPDCPAPTPVPPTPTPEPTPEPTPTPAPTPTPTPVPSPPKCLPLQIKVYNPMGRIVEFYWEEKDGQPVGPMAKDRYEVWVLFHLGKGETIYIFDWNDRLGWTLRVSVTSLLCEPKGEVILNWENLYASPPFPHGAEVHIYQARPTNYRFSGLTPY